LLSTLVSLLLQLNRRTLDMAATQQAPARTAEAAPVPATPAGATQPFVSASLYVGDLHPDVTEVMLLEVFNEVGPVASIRVCRDAVTRRSLGYAYVNFHNFVDADRALEIKNFAVVKDKPIRIMWSHRDPAVRKSGDGNVFIKNLAKEIDNKALFDTFSDYGKILSCKVAVNAEAESKGYGFIHFDSKESAENAIARVNGKSILDKVVTVCHFKSKSERVHELGDVVNRFTNVFIKNLETEVTEEQLRNSASKYGTINSMKIMENNGVSRGFGFVNFELPESAVECVDKISAAWTAEHGKSDKGEIFACRAQKKEEREQELKHRFEQMRIERQEKYMGVNLFVKNLDETVTDAVLKKEFERFGTITSVKVMTEERSDAKVNDGAPQMVSKGFGFVCFDEAENAAKAVTEMHSHMIGSKPIYVALAQRKEARRAQLEAQMARRSNNHMALLRQDPNGQAMPNQGMYPMGMGGMYNGMPQQRIVYQQQQMGGMGGRQQGNWSRGGPRGPHPGHMQQPYYQQNGQGQRTGRQQRTGRGPQKQNRGQNGAQRSGRQYQQGPAMGREQQQMTQQQMQAQHLAQQQAQQQAQQAQQAQQVQQPQAAGGVPTELTADSLAAADKMTQKQMLGERLYPAIAQKTPQLAGKITGMLLEMDNSELLLLLQEPAALDEKINEAVKVLEDHQANQTQGR